MRNKLLVTIILVLITLLAACGGNNEDSTGEESEGSSEGVTDSVQMDWAGGPQGGVWYTAAGGFSSLIGDYNDNITIRAIPGQTLQNIAFVESDEAQLAWNMAFFANAAIEGEEPFEQEHSNFSTLGSGYGDSTFHFVIAANHEYETIEEVFEKGNINIAIAPAANSDDYIFQAMMEFYGTSYEEMEENGVSFFQGSYSEQAEQFRNSNADAIFALSGLPGSSITDAAVNRDLRLMEFPDELIAHLNELGFAEKTIPAGTYEQAVNGNEDIEVVTAANVILINNDVDEEVAYEIVKGINEYEDRLTSIHAAMGYYDLEEAASNLGQLELHPGAEKYYREEGIIE